MQRRGRTVDGRKTTPKPDCGNDPTEVRADGAKAPSCPDMETLRAFHLGELSDEAVAVVAGHLETCKPCEERACELDGTADPVLCALRQRAPSATLQGQTGTTDPSGPSSIVGRYVAGYEILGELGRGGMGVVYKARQVALNRPVALKMILSGPYARPEELLRFQVEYELLARLRHPNIVQIFEVGQHDGRPFFSLEWVEGGTLADRLDGRPQPPRGAAALLEQLARAVHHAHEQGVIHRDLKPANVLLSFSREPRASAGVTLNDCTPKITDFGLAKPAETDVGLTASGEVVGTPSYMAPEQARGARHVGPAADVYALGAILYELLTSRPPFPLSGRDGPAGRAALEILSEVVEREPVSPRRLVPGLPRDLATVCLRCLEKQPERRYASAADLAADLRRFLDGKPVRARRTGELERAWKWARRRPVVAGLLAVTAASLIAGTAVSTYFAVEAGRSAEGAVAARKASDQNATAARLAEKEARKAEADAVGERNQSRRQLALADFREGQRLAEQGRVAAGLLLMVRGLRDVPNEPVDRPFRELVRLNLGAWGDRQDTLRQVIRHKDDVRAAAFSPDGRRFALGCWDGSITLFDAATGEPVGPPLRHGSRVRVLAFSPDGRYLASGGDGHYGGGEHTRVRRWDLEAGRELPSARPGPDDLPVSSLAFSGDGRSFLGATAAGVYLWQTATGEYRQVLSVGPGLIGVYRRTGGPGFWVVRGDEKATSVIRYDETAGPSAPVNLADSAAFSFAAHPDGGLLVCRPDGGLRRYDLETGRPVGRLPALPGPRGVACSPDGRCLVTWAPRTDRTYAPAQIEVRDLATGTRYSAFGHERAYPLLVLSPDGRRLVAASDNMVWLWELARPALRPAPDRSGGDNAGAPAAAKRLRFHEAAFSADRGCVALASATGGVTRVLRRAAEWTGRDLPQNPTLFRDLPGQVAVTPDGALAATMMPGGSVGLWDAESGRPATPLLRQGSQLSAMAFSPDGRMLAVGDYSKEVCLWDTATGWRFGVLKQTDIVYSLAFSPDGRVLAVSSCKDWGRKFGFRLWDVAGARQIGGLNVMPRPARLVFSPDGKALLTLTSEGTQRWDVATGAARGRPLPHAGGVAAAAFQPDGKAYLTGAGGLVRLWDAATDAPIGEAMPGPSAVTAVEFHPDGRLVAVAYADGTARLWDTGASQPVGPTLGQPCAVIGLAFAPGGRTLLTAAADGVIREWPVVAPRGETVDALERELRSRSAFELDAGKVLIPLNEESWRQARAGAGAPAAGPADAVWHATLAQDAEQTDAPLAARRHLDVLTAARPHDWALHARRGRAAAAAGRLGDADADYQRAAALAPAGALAAWYRQRVNDCRAAEQWELEVWYLGRLAAAPPKDWKLFAERAEALARLGRAADAEADRAEAIRQGASVHYVSEVAEGRARQGRWREAGELYLRASPSGNIPFQRAALAVLRAGDRPAYQKLCAALLRVPKQRISPSLGHGIASVCVLAPGAVQDYAPLLGLVNRAVADLARVPGSRQAPGWRQARQAYLTTLGALLVRRGRYREGLGHLNAALNTAGGQIDFRDWAFLAIAHHHLGQTEKAREWLGRLQARRPSNRPEDFWLDTEADLLRQEVEALLEVPGRVGG